MSQRMQDTFGDQVLAILAIWVIALGPAEAASIIDHHQHLMRPQALSVFSSPNPITAADLIAQMDAAGIDRAVVLSAAYGFSNPFKNPGPDEQPMSARRMTGSACKSGGIPSV